MGKTVRQLVAFLRSRWFSKKQILMFVNYCVLSLICLFVVIFFSGCGASHKEKKIEEIQSDFQTAFLQNYSDEQMWDNRNLLIDYQIEKRKTLEDSDVVYGKAVYNTEDSLAKIEIEHVMYYSLYNEGWLLDSMELVSYEAFPLRGSDFSEEDIIDYLYWQGYTSISYLNIDNHVTDLENKIDTYYLTATDSHKYVNTYLNVQMIVEFDPYFYWDYWNSTIYLDGAIENEWSISGYYDMMNFDGSERWSHKNPWYVDAPIGLDLIEYNEYTGYYGFVKMTSYPFDETEDYVIFDVENLSLKEYLLNYPNDVVNSSYHWDELTSGYVAVLDNIDWSKVYYVLIGEKNGFYSEFFITKDQIYFGLQCEYVDDYNRILHCSCIAQFEPNMR